MIPADVPQIYISKTACTGGWPDIELLGQCDVVVAELARRVGWSLKHEMNEVDKNGNAVKVEDALLGFQHQHLVRLTRNEKKPVQGAQGE